MTLTATPARTFRENDKVTVTGGRFPGIWTIAKVNPVNIKLVNDADGSRRNAAPQFLRHIDASGTSTPESCVSVLVPYVAPLPEGTIVRINRPFATFTTRDLFVVTGHGSKRVSLSLLGGGRGLLAPQSGITVVPLTDLAANL